MKLFMLVFVLLITLHSKAYAKEADPTDLCQSMVGFINAKIENGESALYDDFYPIYGKSSRVTDREEALKMEEKSEAIFGVLLGMKTLNNGPDAMLKSCYEALGYDRFEKKQNMMKAAGLVTSKDNMSAQIYGQLPMVQATTAAAEQMFKNEVYMNDCQPNKILKPKEVSECAIVSPMLSIPKGFREFMIFEENQYANRTLRYSPDGCKCLTKRFIEAKKDIKLIGVNADFEEARLDQVIQKATGTKLINEYAALSEDLQYYAATNAWVMQEGTATKVEKKRLCQDSSDFQNAINKLCKENGTSEGSEQRLATLMGSFDSKLSKLPFDEGLKSLVKDIGTYTFDSRQVTKGASNIFTRTEYDKVRQALSKDEPQLYVANDLVTMMLMDEGGMKQILLNNIEDGKSPLHGVMNILTGPNPEYANFLLSKLGQKYSQSNEAFKQLKSEIGTSGFNDKVELMFKVALNLHPGFKNLMNNPELFKKTAGLIDVTSRTEVDLLSVMNNDKKVFNAHMETRCEEVQQHFAEAVCLKKEEIRKRIGPREVLALAEREKGYSFVSQDGKDLALCRMASNFGNSKSFFTNLSMATLNPYETSDYIDRKLNPQAQQNGMAKMAQIAASDKKFATKLSEAANRYDYARVGTGDYKSSPVAQLLAGKNNKNPEELTSSVVPDSSATHRSGSVAPSVLNDVNKSFSQAQPTIAPQNVSQATVSDVKNDDKKHETNSNASYERLSKELASSEDKAKVSSHLKDINEADAQEILRLRDQVLKDQQTISDLRVEEERKKAEILKSDYEQLKSRFDNFERPTDRIAHTQNLSNGKISENSVPQFEAASLAAPGAGPVGSRIGTGSSFSANPGTLQELSGTDSQAAGGSKDTSSQKEMTDPSVGMNLIVVASKGSENNHSTEDPNQALINYLNKNDASVSQLQELKESGLLYTEEDLSIEGKKIHKKKLIKFNELSAEAKVLIERKLASIKVQEVKRNYSRQALMLELFTISLKKGQLSVKQASPHKL